MRIVLVIIWSYVFFTTTRNEEISDEAKWCSLMDKYYQTLSQYLFLGDSKKYNVANLDDWGKSGAKQGLIITPKNFGQFFEKMKNYIPTKEQAFLWNNTNPSPEQIEELNTILSLTLKFEPKVTCYWNEGRMVVQGNILTTNLIDRIMYLQYNSCYKNAKYLEIYATDAILLSQPLRSNGKSMVIIAPIWDVQATTYIDTEVTSYFSDHIKCRGKCPRDGKPGNPGPSAGDMLGIGATYIHMHRLTIFANGRAGQRGQDGQDGANGANGAKSFLSKERNAKNCVEKGKIKVPKSFTFHYCKGSTGKKGKDGGRGGAGGLGGYGGTVNIIKLGNDSNSSPRIKNSQGSRGMDGKAGKGGIGGKNGESFYCIKTSFFPRICYPYEYIKVNGKLWRQTLKTVNKKFPKYPGGKRRAANGKSPSEKNRANIKYPTRAFDLSTVTGKHVLSTFTDLIRKNLIIADYTRKKNYDFLLQLYRNNNVMRNYNTVQLVREFIALESDYHRLFDKIDLLPIYEAFQDHIVTRFPKYENYKNTEADVVLIYLYVTLQSKICTLQDAAKSTFITDINSSLNIFVENVNLLKQNNAYQVIMQTGERYSNEIDAKIEQANNMINKSVIPKIKETTKNTEEYVRGLIWEMERKLKKIKDEKEILEIKEKLLEKSKALAVVSGFFKFIGAIGSVLSKIGPIIKIGCDIISTTANMFNKGFNYQSTTDYGDLTNGAKRSSEKMAEFEKLSKEMNKDLDLFGTGEVSAQSFGTATKGLKAMRNRIQAIASIDSNMDKYDQDVKRIDNDINKNVEIQNILKETKENVEEISIPVLRTFDRIIRDVVTNATGKSFAALSLAQRKLDGFVNELMDILQTLVKKFPSGGKMSKTVKDIISEVKLIIDINKNLVGYIENKKMGNLMVDLQSASYQSSSIRNFEFKEALNKLKICLNTNIIISDYKQTSEQLRQYVFPLARAFMEKRNMESFLRNINNNKENVLDFATSEINIFKTQLSRTTSFIMKYDEIKYRTRFDVGTPVKSFFVWKYEENQKQIQELLAGKEVFFGATPDLHLDKNAVKFNKISLALTDNEEQIYLNEILKDFKIIMVHTGENEYICDNKSYVINTPKVTFQYSFRNDSYKKPLFRNAVYDKLVGTNYQLSPFTLWKFQLVNISTIRGYMQLKKLNQVDVHLVGDGEYYASNSQVCGKDLDEYYEPLIQSEKNHKKPCVYGVPYTEDH